MKKLIFLILLFTASAFGATIDDLVLYFDSPSSSVSFAWDANSEQDLDGYIIYRSSTSGNYTSAVKIIIPLTALADVNNPEYTENNIPAGTWFWVVTAYDIYSNESVYSNELTRTIGETHNIPTVPPNIRLEKTM